MKRKHWNLIFDLSQVADKSGLYIFAIRDDNHLEYSFRHLKKGNALYNGNQTDPTNWFVPIAYHFCNEYQGKMETNRIITENSWYPCDSDIQTRGFRIIAYLREGKLSYALSDSYCNLHSETLVTIEDGWLWNDFYNITHKNKDYDEIEDGWLLNAYNDLIKINPIAYHYVEFFDENGHSYWWYIYQKYHERNNNK